MTGPFGWLWLAPKAKQGTPRLYQQAQRKEDLHEPISLHAKSLMASQAGALPLMPTYIRPALAASTARGAQQQAASGSVWPATAHGQKQVAASSCARPTVGAQQQAANNRHPTASTQQQAATAAKSQAGYRRHGSSPPGTSPRGALGADPGADPGALRLAVAGPMSACLGFAGRPRGLEAGPLPICRSIEDF